MLLYNLYITDGQACDCLRIPFKVQSFISISAQTNDKPLVFEHEASVIPIKVEVQVWYTYIVMFRIIWFSHLPCNSVILYHVSLYSHGMSSFSLQHYNTTLVHSYDLLQFYHTTINYFLSNLRKSEETTMTNLWQTSDAY